MCHKNLQHKSEQVFQQYLAAREKCSMNNKKIQQSSGNNSSHGNGNSNSNSNSNKCAKVNRTNNKRIKLNATQWMRRGTVNLGGRKNEERKKKLPDESYVKVIVLFRAGILANQNMRRMRWRYRKKALGESDDFHHMINSGFSSVFANYVAHKCLSYLNMALERRQEDTHTHTHDTFATHYTYVDENVCC